MCLPAEYRRFLLQSDGGYPGPHIIRPTGGSAHDGTAELVVDHFYPLAGDQERHTGSVSEALRRVRPILGAAWLPIASEPGGWEYLLNMETKTVDLCIGEQGFRLVRVAESFVKFIEAIEAGEKPAGP